MVSIRTATTDDMPWLFVQLRKFSDFYGSKLSLGSCSDEHGFALLSNMMKNHVLFIANDSTHGPVGLIGGFLVPHPFNPQIITLSEQFWWVDEAHRGSRAGLMLLNHFTDYGKEHADWISFSLEHHSPVNEKTLLKRGYRFQERSYILETE